MISTQELVETACPKLGAIGAGFYFTEDTIDVGKQHGLDGFRFYFLGRGGVLGDVEPAVVTSAFGYFKHSLVEQMWNSARERTELSPRETGKLHLECCRDFGRRHLSGLDGLDAFCAAAETVNNAADYAGLSLYAGLAAEPLAEDLPARAMQLAAVLREFRGSAHLLAILTTDGIDPVTAHGLRSPAMWTLFGYEEGTLPEGTPAEHDALAAADKLTDRLVTPAFDALDADGRTALLDGIAAIAQALPEQQAPVG